MLGGHIHLPILPLLLIIFGKKISKSYNIVWKIPGGFSFYVTTLWYLFSSQKCKFPTKLQHTKSSQGFSTYNTALWCIFTQQLLLLFLVSNTLFHGQQHKIFHRSIIHSFTVHQPAKKFIQGQISKINQVEVKFMLQNSYPMQMVEVWVVIFVLKFDFWLKNSVKI